jgi:hypothetical protein
MDVKSLGKNDFTESLISLTEFVKNAIQNDLIDKEAGKSIIKNTLELNGFKYVQ